MAEGVVSTEVEFRSEGRALKGTLTLPRADSRPAPGVVLVHGSGPQTRDEVVAGQLALSFASPVRVFADLAEALSSAGYAVLRYDKRSCGPFNGCADNGYPTPSRDTTPIDFLEDALAATDFLKSRSEVEPDAIFFVGHSQGATLAFEALSRREDLAGAILWREIANRSTRS